MLLIWKNFKLLAEVFRVLAPGGHYICITYGDPEHRKKFLETQQWANLSVDKIPKPSTTTSSNAEENDQKNFHYIYTMTKQK